MIRGILFLNRFTYIGNQSDSIPNPYLRLKDGRHVPAFHCKENYEFLSRKSYLGQISVNHLGMIEIKDNNFPLVIVRSETRIEDPFKLRDLVF